MESLARAGVRVGIVASPLVAGLNDGAAALEALLARARSAGASWACAEPLRMSEAGAERLVRFASRFDPALAGRYARVVARASGGDRAREEAIRRRLSAAAERAGLPELDGAQPAALAAGPDWRAPRQLSLF